MAIDFRAGSAVSTETVSTGSPVVNAPSGLQDGDLIVLAFGGSGNGTTSLNLSNGFSEIHFGETLGSDGLTGVIYKVASGEGSSWTFTNLFSAAESCIWAALAYTGVHQSDPLSGTPTENYPADTANPACTAMTPAVDDSMVISSFGADPDNAARTGTAGSGWTERADFIDSTNAQGYIFVQDLLQGAAASISGDFTASDSDVFGCIQFALRPAAPPWTPEQDSTYKIRVLQSALRFR